MPTTSGIDVRMFSITIDCSDADKLSDFYANFLGWNKKISDMEKIYVSRPMHYPVLIFQQLANYEPPMWPDEPGRQHQMIHIDFAVNDMEQAIKKAVRYGAAMANPQYLENRTVMIDPAGHPFYLSQRRIQPA